MGCSTLKQQFGNDIIFHSGVENQRIFPMNSAKEVTDETVECLKTLGKMEVISAAPAIILKLELL